MTNKWRTVSGMFISFATKEIMHAGWSLMEKLLQLLLHPPHRASKDSNRRTTLDRVTNEHKAQKRDFKTSNGPEQGNNKLTGQRVLIQTIPSTA